MLRYDEVSIEVLLNTRHLFAFFIVVSDYSSSAAGSFPRGPRFGRLYSPPPPHSVSLLYMAREYNSNQSRRFSNYYFPCLSSVSELIFLRRVLLEDEGLLVQSV